MTGHYAHGSNMPHLATPPATQHNPLLPPSPHSAPASILGPNTSNSSFDPLLSPFSGSESFLEISPIVSSSGAWLRRKSSGGMEQVKHRRTRSGCYTCRARRVKVLVPHLFGIVFWRDLVWANWWTIQCDETHPICESMVYHSLPLNHWLTDEPV